MKKTVSLINKVSCLNSTVLQLELHICMERKKENIFFFIKDDYF